MIGETIETVIKETVLYFFINYRELLCKYNEKFLMKKLFSIFFFNFFTSL